MKNLFSVILFCFCLSTTAQQNNLYHIPDTAFLSFLNENYPSIIVNDSLDIDSAASVTYLDIYNTNIENLDGVQFFINSVDFYIYDCLHLTNIPPISNFNNLIDFGMWNTSVINLEISNCSVLSYISMCCNDSLSSV